MTLEERRQKLLENSLMQVNSMIDEILSIRQREMPIGFCFKVGQAPDIFLIFQSTNGMVNNGHITINRTDGASSKHHILPFPLLFLTQICLKCHDLQYHINYTIHNIKMCTLQSVESFLSMANQAMAILSDPKFIKIELTNYFDPPLPDHVDLDLFFQNGCASLLYSAINNTEAGNVKNSDDETLLGALETILRRLIHSLKYLRSEVITWSIPADEEA